MSVRPPIVAAVTDGLVAHTPGFQVQGDINDGFEPPANEPWARISFVDGAETIAVKGGATALARSPILVYVDLFTPLGEGDGLAVELDGVVKNSLRRLIVPGARWQRFEQGPEGVVDGEYRKQVVAVFIGSQRV
jgi:hypothetical protein